MTRIEILREYAKSLADPKYPIETYLKTFDKTQEGFVPFKLFPRQKEIIDAYEIHRFNLVTKPRQAGVSTTTAAYMSIKVGFADVENPEAILIIANKQELAFEFLAKIKDFLSQLPRWVWGDEYYGSAKNDAKTIFITDSKKEIKLPNGSRVKAVATSKDALRGFTPTYLVMDEAAYIDNGAEVFGAALTALGTGGKATLISTPRGMDSLYYKTYDQAIKKKNNFNIIEMKWYEDLRYNKDLQWLKDDLLECETDFTFESYKRRIDDGWKPTSSWYEEMCRGMNNDAKMIAQELDVSFIGSGGNVINEMDIEKQRVNNVRPPKYTAGLENEIWIWEEPVEGHQYIMGCLPPNEKVLTDSGLKNIQEVELTDELINENGDNVKIVNKQIYSVINEDIFEITMAKTYRTTTFTKEHPILISKPILENSKEKSFNFNYTRAEEIEIGDWVKVPNIYRKEKINVLNGKWLSNKKNTDMINSPLTDEEFWWFIGVWLNNGWLGDDKNHSIFVNLSSNNQHELKKINDIVYRLFKQSTSINVKEVNTLQLSFDSEELYCFIAKNFGERPSSKWISEWVKFIPKKYKIALIRGYFDTTNHKNITKDTNITNVDFIDVNLVLLEGIQDIIFSLDIISSLTKLPDGQLINNKLNVDSDVYKLSLEGQNGLALISLIYYGTVDIDCGDKTDSCCFSQDKEFMFFKIEGIRKDKFTGDVYNFECDTHTFMCHHITTHNCDVSRGDGEDSSTIVIIDFTTMEQVMEYQGMIQPDLLAQIVEEYGELYKAYTVVDITGGMGVSTVLKLLEFEYKRLHYDSQNGKILSARQRDLESYNKSDKIPGFHATSVRLPMISNLEYQIRMNNIKIRSERMISEMKTFIYKNGRPDHQDGFHDDLLMALGMALWVLEHAFKKLERLEAQTKAMLTSWVVGTPSESPIDEKERGTGFVSNENRHKKEIKKPTFSPIVAKNMQDPTGKYMWLFSGMK